MCSSQLHSPGPIHLNESDEAKFEKSMLTCFEVANRGVPFDGSRTSTWCVGILQTRYSIGNCPRLVREFSPAFFCGRRLGSGHAHRKVHFVLDYENLKSRAKGFGRPIKVYASELVEPTDGNSFSTA